MRASSLGLAVSDLSWVYCWAAIWGNIELGFGILGAVRLLAIIQSKHKTNINPQNLALSRTYYDFFKRGLDSISSRTGGDSHFHMPNRASYALHSVSKGSAQNKNCNSGNKKNSSNNNKSNKSSSSNPLSNSTLTNNTSTTWDGSQAPNKSSQVQIHGRRRRGSNSSGSGESDEVPLGKEMGLGVNGGIERRIEISVEESAGSRAGSAGGVGEATGWGRDLERDAASEGDAREVRAGRAF